MSGSGGLVGNLAERIARALGAPPLDLVALSGGEVSVVAAGRTHQGRNFVAKTGPARVEAAMLRAIGEAGCPAPKVIHEDDDLLIMSRLADNPATETGWREAGAAIARLHSVQSNRFGWHEPTAFGDVPCPAPLGNDWPVFWVETRLMAWPEVLPTDIAHRVERLANGVDARLDHAPEPRLLHGDLWSGNVLFDGDRFSGLIDPACYFGDPEVDLAMLTLFGAPPPAFLDAYSPLAEGWQGRRALYQLWPALVHLRLFGSGYRGMVERLLDALGA